MTNPHPSPDRVEELPRLLDLAAADDHRETAAELEALRERLGRDAMNVNEWNALIGAASHLRCEAARRERRANTRPESESVTVMREALAIRDADAAKCPIQRGYKDICPRCKATSSDSCGLITGADYAFVEAAREALTRIGCSE